MWERRASDTAYGEYAPARTSDVQSDDMTLADEADIVKEDHERQESHAKPFRDYQPSSPEPMSPNELVDGAYTATYDNWTSSTRWNTWRQRLTNWRNPSQGSDESMQLVGNTAAPRWAQAGQQTVSWMVWPLPSYMHRFFVATAPSEEPRRPTDYLDGLRGVASLFVFFEHYLILNRYHKHIVHQGYGEEESEWNLIQLPFIRIVYAGSAMVSIFFIISGYVLSQRCIVAMRAHKQEKLHNALTSMTFRRAIRLFLPSLIVSFVALIAVLLGFMHPQFPKDWTVGSELNNFQFHLFKDLFKIWDWGINYHHWYAPQLWTIPIEFRCSMILFVWILLIARTTVAVRFIMEFAFTLYLFYMKRWDVALFIVGMILAEVNIIAEERKKRQADSRTVLGEPDWEKATPTANSKWWSRITHLSKTEIALWATLVAGVYLACYPDRNADKTPGYAFLAQMWEGDKDYKFRFWLAMASILIVVPISFLPPAQAFFSTSIARYLGKISYALYLVHVLMNRTVRVFLWSTFWKVLQYQEENGDDIKFEGGWLLGSLIYIPMVLWAADIFWRAVDAPTVVFARWFEGKCFVQTRG